MWLKYGNLPILSDVESNRYFVKSDSDDPKRPRDDDLVWNLANEMEIIIKNKFDLLPITRQLEYFNIIQLN